MHAHTCRRTHTFLQPNDLIGVNCIMTVVNWTWVRGDTGLSGEGDGERMLRRCERKAGTSSPSQSPSLSSSVPILSNPWPDCRSWPGDDIHIHTHTPTKTDSPLWHGEMLYTLNTRIQFDSVSICGCVCVCVLCVYLCIVFNYTSRVCLCVIARAAERALLVKTFKPSSLESCWYRGVF